MNPGRAILPVVMLAALALGGCNTGLPPEVAGLGYVDRELKFALNVPAGWTVRESRGTAAVILAAPGGTDETRPNVTVVVAPAVGPLALPELVSGNRDRLKALIGASLGADEPRTLADGHEAMALTFDHAALEKPVRQRQMYVVAAGRAYTVTATASPQTFDAHQAEFETVFRSFRAAW
jgi:hypothetical protein